MIYQKAAKEAFNECIIDDIIWIRETNNLVDAMKKATILLLLVEMMETGNFSEGVKKSPNRLDIQKG